MSSIRKGGPVRNGTGSSPRTSWSMPGGRSWPKPRSPNGHCSRRARMFRNGLMVALLAYCPIRLKNFAALEIGRSFVNVDGTWWIVLTAAETKEKREDERPVAEDLTNSIERYLRDLPTRPGRRQSGDERALVCNQRQTDELRLDGRAHYRNHKDDDRHPRQSSSLQDRRSDDTGDPRGRQTSRWKRPLASSDLGGPQENYNRASCVTAGKSLAATNREYRDR